MLKCLICNKGIAVNDRCMSMKVEHKMYSIHMSCEHEMTKLKSAILMILAEWDGIWYKYEKLLEDLKAVYSLTPSRKEAKESLQFLVKTGEVFYGPLVNSDYIPCGAGYSWKYGAGI